MRNNDEAENTRERGWGSTLMLRAIYNLVQPDGVPESMEDHFYFMNNTPWDMNSGYARLFDPHKGQ
jgi:hypothetical protein